VILNVHVTFVTYDDVIRLPAVTRHISASYLIRHRLSTNFKSGCCSVGDVGLDSCCKRPRFLVNTSLCTERFTSCDINSGPVARTSLKL